MTRQTAFFPLQGGLDLVTPPVVMQPGRLITAYNYESHPRGYQRIAGFERLDGRPRPSDASYAVLRFQLGSQEVQEGDTVTGATSGASGIALLDGVLENGSYTVGDALGYLVLTDVAGVFQQGEDIQIGGSRIAEAAAASMDRGAQNDEDDQEWLALAVERRRSAIEQVPGSGPVRGVWIYEGNVYAFRDNAAGTAGVMHKSTPSGWQAVDLGYEIAFTGGGLWEIAFSEGGTYEIQPDDVIYGAVTQASAIVRQVILESGSWAGGDAAGRLVLSNPVGGSFIGERINVGTGDEEEPEVALVDGPADVLAIEDGDTITGETSGATASVVRVVLESGDWSTGDAAGRLIVSDQSGTFQAEAIRTGDQDALASVTGDAAAITLPPGGRYDFVNHNFYGATDLRAMYGANGVGRAFEWDGEVFVPLHTGMEDDRPTRVAVHRNHLFLSFRGGSVQHSALGNPYDWQVLTGAGEIGIGEEVTGMLADVAGALVIFGRNKVATLLGDDAANWILNTLSNDSGAVAWTAQRIGTPVYLDDRGLRSLETTDAFGDFNIGTLSQMVEPIFNQKKREGLSVIGSLRVRAKDQYRLFWDDGSGISLYFARQPAEVMPFDLGVLPTCFASGEDLQDRERLLIGTDDGWVYEVDAGNSFDGEEVHAYLRMPFNHVGSPSHNKRWLKAVLELDCGPRTHIGVIPEFGYGNPDQPPGQEIAAWAHGSGGLWNEMIWDRFYWSTPIEGQMECPIDGLGTNLSIAVASTTIHDEPHVIHGMLLHYTARGIAR